MTKTTQDINTSLKDCLNHKERHLMIDRVSKRNTETNQLTFNLSISKNDPLGRDFFYHQTPCPNTLDPVMQLEPMILAAFVDSGHLETNEHNLLMSVQHVAIKADCYLGEPLSGTLHYKGRIGQAARYKGALYSKQSLKSWAEIIVGRQVLSAETSPSRPNDLIHEDDQTNTWIDSIQYNNKNGLTLHYTYLPPLAMKEGHVKDNSMMMGMLQWRHVLNGLNAYIDHHQLKGSFTTISCHAIIRDSHHNPVTIMRGITIKQTGSSQTLAVKSITFKAIIKMGDTIVTEINHITMED